MASVTLVWRSYLRLLEKKPLATKVATGGVITSVGDVAAQLLLEKRTELDFLRLAVVSGFGLMGSVIEGHFWLGYLERTVGASMGVRAAFKKMVLDVGVFTPIEVASFLSWTHVLEGRAGPLGDKLQADYIPTLLSSFFWTPFSLAGFLFVPFHLRVLYGTSVCLMWDTFLSYASHNQLPNLS